MTRRNILSFILLSLTSLLSGFLLNSCQEKDVVEVTEIVFTNLSTGKKTLTVGEEFKIKWVVVPEQLQETAEIFWETSDRKVAKVKKGVIEATGPGEATITATSGKAKTSVLVKVDAVQVESLEFPHFIQVYQDATVEVKFNNVEPEDASLTTVEWEVETYESGGDATVEADVDCIYVTGTEEGIVTLYGRVDGVVIGHCEIEIRKRIPVESVTVTLSKSSVQFGESLTVSTYVSPSNASLKDVNITCSPASYVTVEGNTITAGETAGTVTV